MSPIETHLAMYSSISDKQWRRYEELQEQHRVMRPPWMSRRQRYMLAGGRALIAAGNRLQQAAGLLPQIEEFDAPCLTC
jgi:hypothetical protein